MRISSDHRDSGHRTYLAWGGPTSGARVLLNGEEVKHCVTADEELGEVLVWLTDEAGKIIVEGDEVRSEWRRGKVEVILPARDAA